MGNLPDRLAFIPDIVTVDTSRSKRFSPDQLVAKVEEYHGRRGPIIAIGIDPKIPVEKRIMLYSTNGDRRVRIGYYAPSHDIYYLTIPNRNKHVTLETSILRQVRRLRRDTVSSDTANTFENATVIIPSMTAENVMAACFATGALPLDSMRRAMRTNASAIVRDLMSGPTNMSPIRALETFLVIRGGRRPISVNIPQDNSAYVPN